MTNSVRLAVFSGSSNWENQYAEAIDQFESQITELKNHRELTTMSKTINELDQHRELLDQHLENIFEKLRKGEKASAKDAAFSMKLETLIQNFDNSLSTISTNLEQKTKTADSANEFAKHFVLALSVFNFAFFLGLFISMYRLLTHWSQEVQNHEKTLTLRLKQKTQEVLHQQADLVAASKLASLGELVSGIAHEINNPLGIIAGTIQVSEIKIAAAEISPEFRAELQKTNDKVLRMIDRISKIVASLKVYSRNSDMDPPEPVALSLIISNTLELVNTKIKTHSVRLDIADPIGIIINCRENQFVQVFANLIANSCDAIQNLPDRWIKIEFENSQSHFGIHFTDSGPGIPPEIVARLMQPFFTTKSAGKGTGLGLSISKKIIESYSGEFLYTSHNIAGKTHTRFSIQLPLNRVEFSDKQKQVA